MMPDLLPVVGLTSMLDLLPVGSSDLHPKSAPCGQSWPPGLFHLVLLWRAPYKQRKLICSSCRAVSIMNASHLAQ